MIAATHLDHIGTLLLTRIADSRCPLCGGDVPPTPTAKLECGDLLIAGISVSRGGRAIRLTIREFQVLVFLMQNQGRELTRTDIAQHALGQNFEGLSNIVDVYINYLRNKIDKPFPTKLIHTVRGVGYKLEALEAQTA